MFGGVLLKYGVTVLVVLTAGVAHGQGVPCPDPATLTIHADNGSGSPR
jgi:hypothetical protein